MGVDEPLERAEELLERLEAARAKLDASEDPDEQIAVLEELATLAKEVEAELQKARAAAEADAADA
jgi:hypothetical protein